ncbi:MAG: hypothetical protein WD226_01760 [Planctomycetota bacterium]
MKDRNRWEVPVTAVACTLAGLLLAGLLRLGDHDDEHAEDEHGVDPAEPLAPATLRNMGVVTGAVELSSWTRTMSVSARVEDTPDTERPIYAPWRGRVLSIAARRGTVVAPGEPLVTILRDAIPRPALRMTAAVLQPMPDQLHERVLDLRTAREDLRIVEAELERVEGFTRATGEGLPPVFPRQRAIELGYDRARAAMALEQARLELHKHGLTDEQIEAMAEGASLPEMDEHIWRRALAENGLWSADAERLAEALPQALRDQPWVIATVSELAVGGLVTEELIEWLAREKVAPHFLSIGSLLLQGETLARLQHLEAENAFEPVVEIAAPPLPAGASWDVVDVTTKVGAFVDAGAPLVGLRDPRTLLLRSQPVGGEVVAVLAAARSQAPIEAAPFVAGAGPVLTGLTIDHVESSPANQGTAAVIVVANRVAASSGDDTPGALRKRTWSLRAGMTYELRVPLEVLDDVYVLPASAVTEVGPDLVVYLLDGDVFRPVPVAVAHRDHRVAIVPATPETELFPGDVIALEGAFELSLALETNDAPDPHAGHSH